MREYVSSVKKLGDRKEEVGSWRRRYGEVMSERQEESSRKKSLRGKRNGDKLEVGRKIRSSMKRWKGSTRAKKKVSGYATKRRDLWGSIRQVQPSGEL